MSEIKKVSRFEYALTKALLPETIGQYKTYTREEEQQQRVENLKSQARRIRISRTEHDI